MCTALQSCPRLGMHNLTGLYLAGETEPCNRFAFDRVTFACPRSEQIEFYRDCESEQPVSSYFFCLAAWTETFRKSFTCCSISILLNCDTEPEPPSVDVSGCRFNGRVVDTMGSTSYLVLGLKEECKFEAQYVKWGKNIKFRVFKKNNPSEPRFFFSRGWIWNAVCGIIFIDSIPGFLTHENKQTTERN